MQVLDHGYLRYVEHWGSDERIVEAIRQSTQGGFISWEPYEGHPKGDGGVLGYCWNGSPKHTGPFEFAGLVVEVQAPIMVFREWHRHRTMSYAEASARHTPLPAVDYLPRVERCCTVSRTNKQAGAMKGASEVDSFTANAWLDELEELYAKCEAVYQSGLKTGVPKEIARLALTVGRYSRMRASANLLNWFRFLLLRLHGNAQYEIREYAQAVALVVAETFPRSWALFEEGCKNGPNTGAATAR